MEGLDFTSKPGETPLDDISGLIPGHIRTREALNRAEFENNNRAAAKYFLGTFNRRKAPFTAEWFKKLHKEMFGEVWRWAGEFRRSEKNTGVRAYQIGEKLHELIYDMSRWEKESRPPVEAAARIHHRLAWVHPFENGNGRWARMAVDIYLLKNSGRKLRWPVDTGFIEDSFRAEYIEALKAADAGELGLMIALHEKYSK